MQLLVKVHFTVKEEITPEWLCIFIIISIISREVTLTQVHFVRYSYRYVKDGKASSKNHGIVCLCGVYMPGGNYLRKSKHKYYYGINSIHSL